MARRRRQSKDDFPSELRYSQQRLWVSPGLAGTARIGLNVPSISERPQNVYYLDVQRRGYLVAGRPFGTVDLDASRLQLIAPFSGRITRVNWEAVNDPLLVRTDPFTDGWLVEVSRVKRDALNELLTRDAFWSFLEFERLARRLGIKPVLGASYRMQRGMAWPDELRVTFGGLTVLTSRVLRLGRNPTFTPQWSLGDSWTVEVLFEQPSLATLPAERAGATDVCMRWRYEVWDTEGAVEGEPCFSVKVIEAGGPPPLSYFLLSIGKDDFSLRRVEEVSVYDQTRRTLTPNDWGKETFLELRQRRELVVDLPLFPVDNRDEARTIEVEGEPAVRQEAKFPDDRTMKIVCEAQMGDDTLRSEQTWERGQPWWTSAERRLGESLLLKGRLVPEGAAAPSGV